MVENSGLLPRWQWRSDGFTYFDYDKSISQDLENAWRQDKNAIVRVVIREIPYDIDLAHFQQVNVNDPTRSRRIQRIDESGAVWTIKSNVSSYLATNVPSHQSSHSSDFDLEKNYSTFL